MSAPVTVTREDEAAAEPFMGRMDGWYLGRDRYDDLLLEAFARHRQSTEAASRVREAELERLLAQTLDVADEAYRKYCGEMFEGFDAEDVAVLQASRTYWWENYGRAAARATATPEQGGEDADKAAAHAFNERDAWADIDDRLRAEGE